MSFIKSIQPLGPVIALIALAMAQVGSAYTYGQNNGRLDERVTSIERVASTAERRARDVQELSLSIVGLKVTVATLADEVRMLRGQSTRQ